MLNNINNNNLKTILVYEESHINTKTKLKNICNDIYLLIYNYNFIVIWIIVIIFCIIIVIIFYTCF